MEWGREIEVNGVRPAWLRDDATPVCHGGHAANAAYWGFESPKGYCLPADHWAYRALDAGFEPWGGGVVAPEDWDGGEVLFKNGGIYRGAYDWRHDNLPFTSFENIIGYRKRVLVRNRALPAAEQPEGDTVTIKRMTETEWKGMWAGLGGIDAAHRLGIIREETPAERFARETGHEVTPAVEAALAWGKAA